MKTCIILVGSELLNGMMIDTNSMYIAEELNKYAIEISNKIIVGDRIDEIVKAIGYAKEISDLVIISGGLGPTIDDLTRDAIATYTKKDLTLDSTQLQKIRAKYKTFASNMPASNERQVMFPEGSLIIDNDKGAAPAFFIDDIVAFPGVPSELEEALPKFLEFYVKKYNLSDRLLIKDIVLWGIPESLLEDKLIDLVKYEKEVFVEFLVKDYGTILRLNVENSKKEKLYDLKDKIYSRVSEYIFGEDNDRLENIILSLLENRGYKLSVAESCTGGLLSSIIISNPGASKVYTEGFVVYSNEAKVKNLSVNKASLEKYGAVSKETVLQMLEGLITEAGIAISGIAGPNGGTREKPVGTVFIGIKLDQKYIVEEFLFRGDREESTKKSILHSTKYAKARIGIKK